jgi:hypothetical protein
MKAKIAYQTKNYQSGVVEIDYQWSEWRNDIPIEDANIVQVEVYIREALCRKLNRKQEITQFVVLDGELKDWLQDNYKDPFFDK